MKKDLMSYCGEDILESADAYVEKAKAKRIRTLRIAAAVAAAVIIAVSIPVGAMIIKQPAAPIEDNTDTVLIPDPETVSDAENAGEVFAENYMEIVVYTGVDEYEMTASGIICSGAAVLNDIILTGKDRTAYRLSFEANGAVMTSDNPDSYPLKEGRITYFVEKFKFLIPDGVSTGSIEVKLLANGDDGIEETVMQRCLSFAMYYDLVSVSYGEESPEHSGEELLALLTARYGTHLEHLIKEFDTLTALNESGAGLDEDQLAKLERITAVIEKYKRDNPDIYIERGTETSLYKKSNEWDNLTFKNTRYDPNVLDTTINGNITWEFPNGDYSPHVLPAKNITVKCYINNSNILLGTSLTDEFGDYSIVFDMNGGTIINVKLVASIEGCGISICSLGGGNAYTQIIDVRYIYAGLTVDANDFCFDKEDLSGQAISVHQALEMSNRYIYSLENNYMDQITVFYPSDSYSMTSQFSPSFETIYITSLRKYAWDTIQHEYGHYVAYVYSLKGTYSGNNNHSFYENLSLRPELDASGIPTGVLYGKDKGTKMAWSEGWATYFAIGLQRFMNAASLGLPYIGDTSYDNGLESTNIHVDIETLPTNVIKCECNELTVAAFLLDLVDPISYLENDITQFNDNLIWCLIKTYHCKILSELALRLYWEGSIGGVDKLKVGHICTNLNLAPNNITVYNYSSATPNVIWNYPTNGTFYCKVLIFSSGGVLLNSSPNIYSDSYIIPENTWSYCKSVAGNMIFIVVECYEEINPVTGPYRGMMCSFMNI